MGIISLSPRLLACVCLLAIAAPLAMAALPDQISIPRFKRGHKVGKGSANVVKASARPLKAVSGATGPDLPTVSPSTGPAAPAPPPPSAPPLTLSACSFTLYTLVVTFPAVLPTAFNLALDTGSSDLYVGSDYCDYTCAGDPNEFPISTPGSLGVEDELLYGSGASIGLLYTEDVSIGSSLPTALNQHILATLSAVDSLITPETCLFDLAPTYYTDGLIGVGVGALSVLNINPPGGSIVDFLAQQGVPKVITTLLCDLGGYFFVGGFDPTTVTQTPSFTPLLTLDFPTYPSYIVNVNSVTLGGQDVGFNATAPWIMDTGTNFLEIQGAAAAQKTLDAAFFALLGIDNFFTDSQAVLDEGDYEFECVIPDIQRSAVDAALPPMEFTLPAVGGGTFTVSYPATYSYIQVQFASDGTSLLCPNLFEGQIFSGLFNIFPNELMNDLEIIFDQVNEQIGFGPTDGSACRSRTLQQLQYQPQQPPPPAALGPPAAPSAQAPPPPAVPAPDAESPPPPLALRVSSPQPPPPAETAAPPSPSPPPPAVAPPTPAPTTPDPAAPTPGPVASPTPLASPTPAPHKAPHPKPHHKPPKPPPPPPPKKTCKKVAEKVCRTVKSGNHHKKICYTKHVTKCDLTHSTCHLAAALPKLSTVCVGSLLSRKQLANIWCRSACHQYSSNSPACVQVHHCQGEVKPHSSAA